MTFEEFWENYQSGESYYDDSELMNLLKTVAKHSWEEAQPKWMPIEYAPKDMDILAFSRNYVFIARYVTKKSLSAAPIYGDWAEYCEEDDEYFCPEGWYKKHDCEICDLSYSQIDFEIGGWMPLSTVSK